MDLKRRRGINEIRVASYAAVITAVLTLAVFASVYLGLGASGSSSPTISAKTTSSTNSGIGVGTASSSSAQTTMTGTGVGNRAPDFQVDLTNGTTTRLSDFRGHTALLWFVTVGCSDCEVGAQLISQQYYAELHAKGVTILTVQLYNNLGLEGSSFSGFATQYGGGSSTPGWLFGTSGQDTTYTYDPKAFLDVYYVLDSQGRVTAAGTGLAADLPSVVSEF